MRQDLEHTHRGRQVVDQPDAVEGGIDDCRILGLALEEADPAGGDVLADVLQTAGREIVHDDHLVALRQMRIDEM